MDLESLENVAQGGVVLLALLGVDDVLIADLLKLKIVISKLSNRLANQLKFL
jgi:hypothetical protein